MEVESQSEMMCDSWSPNILPWITASILSKFLCFLQGLHNSHAETEDT